MENWRKQTLSSKHVHKVLGVLLGKRNIREDIECKVRGPQGSTQLRAGHELPWHWAAEAPFLNHPLSTPPQSQDSWISRKNSKVQPLLLFFFFSLLLAFICSCIHPSIQRGPSACLKCSPYSALPLSGSLHHSCKVAPNSPQTGTTPGVKKRRRH